MVKRHPTVVVAPIIFWLILSGVVVLAALLLNKEDQDLAVVSFANTLRTDLRFA